MQLSKAVITAGGRGAKQYPASDPVQRSMLPLVDQDGFTKPVLQIIAEEAIDSGIEKICVVCGAGDEEFYRKHLNTFAAMVQGAHSDNPWAAKLAARTEEVQSRLEFAIQENPEGYGHAVWCAKKFVRDEPFLLLLGDHVYVSGNKRRCAKQLIETAKEHSASVSAVKATPEHLIHLYGTVQGKRVHGHPKLYEVTEMIEKPNPSLAELRLLVPGLRQGHYLCFFGMHVLQPTVMSILEDQINDPVRGKAAVGLTPALNQLAARTRYLALESDGARYNLGTKFGMTEAQIAMALSGIDREEMLELLLSSVIKVRRSEGPSALESSKGDSQV